MIVATPVMIVPLKRETPSLVLISILCGIEASAFENTILNGAPAGALSEAGAKAKSFASTALITAIGVGRGVGFGVGAGLVVGVGRRVGFGVGVGLGVGVGRRVGFGVAVSFGVAVWVGLAEVVGSALTPGVNPGPIVVAAVDGNAVDDVATGEPTCGDPPQAATIRPTAISRGIRESGTAAL